MVDKSGVTQRSWEHKPKVEHTGRTGSEHHNAHPALWGVCKRGHGFVLIRPVGTGWSEV